MLVFSTCGKAEKLTSEENNNPIMSAPARHKEKLGKAKAFPSKDRMALLHSKPNRMVSHWCAQSACLLGKFRSCHTEGQ